jgi:hypothetical protein
VVDVVVEEEEVVILREEHQVLAPLLLVEEVACLGPVEEEVVTHSKGHQHHSQCIS